MEDTQSHCRPLSLQEHIDKAMQHGTSRTYSAAQGGHIEALQAPLNAGEDIGKAEDKGIPPTYAAAHVRHAETLQALITARADVDKAMQDGRYPTYIAAQGGQCQLAAPAEGATHGLGCNSLTINTPWGVTPHCRPPQG